MSLRHRYWWVPTLLLAVGMTACQHKHLSDEGDCPSPHQELRVEALYRQNWEIPFRNGTVWEENWPADFGMDYKDLRPFLPQGFRMSFYNGDALLGSTNLPTHGGRYYRQKGNYSLLFFNNDSEYIVFEGMDRLSTARATTRVVSRPGHDFPTTAPPDMLYGTHCDEFCIDDHYTPLSVELQPLVFCYLIRYKFLSGIEYVALARGALSGMADGVLLHDGCTHPSTTTLLYRADITPWGVQAMVNSFGIPDFEPDKDHITPHDHMLNLEVRLKNGKVKNFDFDVTDQVHRQPRGGVIIVDSLVISGGEFEVDVEDWGDYEDILLPIDDNRRKHVSLIY